MRGRPSTRRLQTMENQMHPESKTGQFMPSLQRWLRANPRLGTATVNAKKNKKVDQFNNGLPFTATYIHTNSRQLHGSRIKIQFKATSISRNTCDLHNLKGRIFIKVSGCASLCTRQDLGFLPDHIHWSHTTSSTKHTHRA